MGRIIDSEAHAWTRIPFNWRHNIVPGEERSELDARNAANYKPSRPVADGSFAAPEDTSDELLATFSDGNGSVERTVAERVRRRDRTTRVGSSPAGRGQ